MTDLDLPTTDLAPFEREFDSALAVPSEVADLLFRQAATAYSFSDEPVTPQQIRAVHELVKWGPTAMNTQPLRIVLVSSPEARERLVPHMAGGNQARTAAAPLVALLASDTDFHDELPRLFPAVPGARDRFADEQARAAAAHTNAVLQAGIDALLAQTRSIERVVAALKLPAISLEGSASLDDPGQVFK